MGTLECNNMAQQKKFKVSLCQFLCTKIFPKKLKNIDGLVQDYSNSIADALELLQSCTKPSMWSIEMWL